MKARAWIYGAAAVTTLELDVESPDDIAEHYVAATSRRVGSLPPFGTCCFVVVDPQNGQPLQYWRAVVLGSVTLTNGRVVSTSIRSPVAPLTRVFVLTQGDANAGVDLLRYESEAALVADVELVNRHPKNSGHPVPRPS